MSNDIFPLDRGSLRGTDSNSLLRMYDLVTGVFTRAKSQQERARAGKAVEQLVKELRKRNVLP